MRSSLSRYFIIVKRWFWLVLLGILLCGSTTFIVSRLMKPVYQAQALLMLTVGSATSASDNTTAAITLLPTYSQLLQNKQFLDTVAAKHGLTGAQLLSMMTVKPQSNTQIIELSVQNQDPNLAAQLTNEIADSFNQYVNGQLGGYVQFQVIHAIVPTTPIRPNPPTDALIGAIVGLGLSVALVVVFEWMDDRLSSPEEVRTLLGLEPLTVIPLLSRRQRNQNAEETPALAEGCRILCAAMTVAQGTQPFKLVMVTSALAGEGKSTIAANVASFLALSGKRVLLVDADLRNPVLDQHFQLDNRKGLSNALIEMWGQQQIEMENQPTEIPSLRVLTAGVLPSNPSELLQSHLAQQLFTHMRNTQQFDYIILDTPPVLPVADAQIVASYVQAAILVTDASRTPRKVLRLAKQTLSRSNTRILGIAINKSPWTEYGELQDYLVSMGQRPRADIAISMTPNMPNMPQNHQVPPGMMRTVPNSR